MHTTVTGILQAPAAAKMEHKRPPSLTMEQIDDMDLDDIEPALDLMEKYNLPIEGIETVTQAQKALRQYLSYFAMDEDKAQVL